MSFGDYMWNDPYARCKAKGDAAGIATLENTYLASADENIEFYRSMSRAVYGHDIPYVLLMHVGAFDAELLPQLLQLYREKGFEIVTLPEAERDDFYRSSTDLTVQENDTLESAIGARQIPLPQRTDFSKQLDALCR
jgi:hypothetical protein